MNSYREQFFEWVNEQPLYQAMNLRTKEMALHLVDCWLNNSYAYLSNARLDGKDFAKRCAIDFCWFIRNRTISDLRHQLKVAEKALELACDKIADILAQNGGAWFYDFDGDTVIERDGFENFYKRYVQEMLKDE